MAPRLIAPYFAAILRLKSACKDRQWVNTAKKQAKAHCEKPIPSHLASHPAGSEKARPEHKMHNRHLVSQERYMQ